MNMTLDQNETDRSYLFGRLLGVADVIEERATNWESAHETNAVRYTAAFSMRPKTTWKTIFDAIEPYRARQRSRGYSDCKTDIDEITNKFSFEDFSDKPLDGRFLLGYSGQRILMSGKKQEQQEEEE
jgi:CRISPR-associated protein Csd1